MNQTQVLEKPILVEGLKWEPKVVGFGKMISSPLIKDGWRLVPFDQDNSSIPYESLERELDLIRTGHKIVGFVIAHEIEEPKPEPITQPQPQFANKPLVTEAGVSNALETILTVAAFAIGGLLYMFLAAGVSVICHSDPVLIAIVDTGPNDYQDYHRFVWVEVTRWYE